jgi:serine/threonine protein kinase
MSVEIGQKISHYQIKEKLGEGGMGEVYLADDLKLERNVAIKFLPQHRTKNKENVERFKREAKAAASLNHPNIVTVHEIAEEDNNIFIVMEYIEGHTLSDIIKSEPLQIEHIIEYTIQIAESLQIAHQKGIIHRDIKSENIMVTKTDQIKVMDFGLAKLRGSFKITNTTGAVGTFGYMSPEMLRGKNVDHRIDIWSLGVLIYEMITGQLPFRGEGEFGVIYSIVNESFEPINKLRGKDSEVLNGLIGKCLKKNPNDRYQHLDNFIVDLRKLKRDSELEIITSTKHRKPFIVLLLILSAVIIITAGYSLIKQFMLEKDTEFDLVDIVQWENSIAVLPFVDLSLNKDQEWFCDGMTEQIISNLSQLPQLKVIGRQSVMRYKDSDRLISEIGEELNVAYVLESSIRKSGNRIRVTTQLISTKDNFHVWSKEFDREYGVEFFDLQDELSQSIAINLLSKLSTREIAQIKTSRPVNTEAFEYFMKGKHFTYYKFLPSYSEAHFNTSEQLYKRSITIDPKFSDAYASLAELYVTHWDDIDQETTKDSTYLKLASTYIDSALKLDSQSAEAYAVQSYIFTASYQWDSAYKSAKKALKINRNHAYANFYLSILYDNKGLANLAIKYLTYAIEINPLDPWYYIIRARNYEEIREYQSAETDYKEALKLEPDHHIGLYQYSLFFIRLNKYENAKTWVDKFGRLYPDSYLTNDLRSILYAMSGDKKKALELIPTQEARWLYFADFIAYQFLGMKEEAIHYLSKRSDWALRLSFSRYLGLKTHMIFDPVRSDPRFQEILAKQKKMYEENLTRYPDIDI